MSLLYKIAGQNIKQIKTNPFKLEKDIQRLIEANLFSVMGLELVKSECPIKNKRIDTLAFDKETKSFVIIEYKRDKNSSVVDQGFTYLNLMLNNKADFIIEYNEALKGNLKRNNVDWSQTRVIFVSQSFTENQIESVNFKDIGIELWEVQRFDDNLISVDRIKKSATTESIKPIMKSKLEYEEVVREIKVYTEDKHLESKSDEVKELYSKFKAAILNLADNIEIKPLVVYIAFKHEGQNICDIEIYKKSLRLYINKKKGTLEDPKKLTRDISKLGHHGNGDYDIDIPDDRNIEYIMSLIKQAL